MSDNGGPAFPQPLWPNNESAERETGWDFGFGGLSRRDYFAAKALAGLCANGNTSPLYVAKLAYELADAMLKMREMKS